MTDDELYTRAMLIYDRKANGLWLPIIRHLAMRRYAPARVVLANWYDDNDGPLVWNTAPFGSKTLLRRAWQLGEVTAAKSYALDCFNSNDMQGFRK